MLTAMKHIYTLFFMLISCACLAQETSLKFGGEVRHQYFHFTNQDWGAAPEDKDGYILSRFLGHADLKVGQHFRAFVQLQSSLADGEAESPSPVDRNPLDVHQAFVDLQESDFTLRVGRQELTYGSQRLVAVREAPNNRQSFDGAKLRYAGKDVKLDAFYSLYVPAKPNIFDDGINNGTQFWGAYATLFGKIDLYYLGLYKKNTTFDEGKGSETRHSVGSRIFANIAPWQYDIEGVYQFGYLAGGAISAWTLSANISYTFQTKVKPQVGLKTEAISGDRNRGDGRLNTFNPLFPKGAYFGLAALIGPYNLLDAHPYAQVNLTKKLILSGDYDLFWRMDSNDGLYAVNGKLLYSSTAGSSKNIGQQLGAALEYTPGKQLYLRQEITWFSAGEFLKQAGPGKDILMLGSTITFKF
jgi:hypothetical protein